MQVPPDSSIILPCIHNKDCSEEAHNSAINRTNLLLSGIGNTNEQEDAADISQTTAAVHGLKRQQFFIEPDLITEVPTENFYSVADYPVACHSHVELHSSCLDQDGYPRNFGLPKLDRPATKIHSSATGETLPCVRQRRQHLSSCSIASSSSHISHIGKSPTCRLSGFPAQPTIEINYAAMIPMSFSPPSPVPYYGDIVALSSYQFLQDKKQSDSTEVDSNGIDRLGLIIQPLVRLPSSEDIVEHPESPDEGYVGDATDV